jgi:hypothetical protein
MISGGKMSYRHFFSILVAAVVCGVSAVSAQTFSSGSTGSDNALNFTTPGTIDFDPVALGLNPAGDNIFNFTTINIGTGVVVKMRSSKLRQRPVVFLATGAVTIAGTLALDGGDGYTGTTPDLRVPSEPGPGGYPGGVGATLASPSQPGAGPGGGPVTNTFHGCGSYQTSGTCLSDGSIYGNSLLVPLRGGSGASGTSGNAGGGAGGGAIQIVSSVSITITGSITANGGGGGSSGSGGAIHLEAPVVAGSGTVQAIGGHVGSCCGETANGGSGWIRVDTTTNSFTGTYAPAAIFGPLFNVPLPSAAPSVKITSINGITVPTAPTASFTSPDIVVSSSSAVPVSLAATNIPLGTIVTLVISSETGTDQTVSATALTGTVANSTATANVVWPLGVSRVFIRAIW